MEREVCFLMVAAALGLGAAGASAQVVDLQIAYLAQAMEAVYIDTGFLTTLENLDDTLASPGSPDYQYLNDEGGALVVRPNEGVPFRRVLTGSEWQGPYLTGGSGTDYEGGNGDYDEGTLLDPWLRPYYFYSPLGLIEPKTGGLSLRHYGDDFDTYTIVSLGPDGVVSSDDVTRSLGMTVSGPTISSARLRIAATWTSGAGLQLVIKGYGLGTSQNGSEVLFNSVPAAGATVTSWSPREVVLALSTPPPEHADVSIEMNGGGVTRAVAVTDETASVGVEDWVAF